jgi:hypothetical protein
MVLLNKTKTNNSGKSIYLFLITGLIVFLIIIPQFLNFGKCVPLYDMAEYLKLGTNPFSPVGQSFTYRIFVPLLAFYFNSLTSISVPICFWLIGLLSSILYFIVLFFILKSAFFKSFDSEKSTYYSYWGVLISIFCFTFQFYFRDYILVDQLALLLGMLMLLCYLYDKILLLSIVSVVAVLTKENNLILAFFIGVVYLAGKNRRVLFLFLPLLSWLLLRLFWFNEQGSVIDSHFLLNNAATILNYHIRVFPATLTPVYGVFGFVYLIYFYDLFTNKSKETILIFLYFLLISLASLLVTGSFRAFGYFTPFIIYKSVPYILNSRFRWLIFLNIILTHLIMVYPYLWREWYEPTLEIRTCLSVLAVLTNLISFLYILRKKGLSFAKQDK